MRASINIIFLGAPGAGKGTQAQLIEKNWDSKPLATGEMLRRISSDMTSDDPLPAKLRQIMAEGQLIPDDTMIELLQQEIGREKYKNGFILDGFPRTEPQAIALEEMLAKNDLRIDAVIMLTAEEKTLCERILGRVFCSECGANFHTSLNPPKQEGLCDACNTKLERRKDDNTETLRKRLDVFHAQTEPILPYYKEKGLLTTIDGMREIAQIAEDIQNTLANIRK